MRGWIWLGVLAVVLAACAGGGESVSLEKERVITGEEALRLYGVTPDPVPRATPTVLDVNWFPREAWVSASVLPYDDPAPIRMLPVYSDASLDVSGTWLGDLEEGSEGCAGGRGLEGPCLFCGRAGCPGLGSGGLGGVQPVAVRGADPCSVTSACSSGISRIILVTSNSGDVVRIISSFGPAD